jgi:hypothetical protein
MIPRHAAAALVFACALLVQAESGTGQEKPPSPFAGDYNGPYNSIGMHRNYRGNNGIYAITIDANGNIGGNTKSNTTGDITKLRGSIEPDGKTVIVVKFPSQTYTMKGTLTKTSAGNIRGTLVQYTQGEAVARDEIDLRPVRRVTSSK